jgi:hypothetical protein
MRFRVSILLVVAVFAMVGFASGDEPFPYPSGEKQVVFGFSGWSVGAYDGGLGFRLFHSGRLASLIMLDLGITISSSEAQYDSTGSHSDHSGVGFGASYTLEKYLSSFHSVAPYVGVGAGYGYSWSEEEYTGGISKSTKHRAVLQGVLGAEWAFTSGISLGARYYLRLERNWTKYKSDHSDGSRYTRNTDTWSFISGAGYLTASIRF